jgi:hypothetical protein
VDFTKIRSQVPALQPIWTIPQGIKEVWSDADERGLTTDGLEVQGMYACSGSSSWPLKVDWTYRTSGSAELRVPTYSASRSGQRTPLSVFVDGRGQQ